MVRVDARELYLLAQIILSHAAQKTLLARDARLDRHSISRLEPDYPLTTLDHDTRSFVA